MRDGGSKPRGESDGSCTAPDELLGDANDLDRPSRFSSLHARTYEMELLLSGAVVFALVQLARVMRTTFTRLATGVDGDLFLIFSLGLGYMLLTAYLLIGAFVLHLALRAFWIGLLGLESVFPGGIRWREVKGGPYSVEYYRRKVGSLALSIERVDDWCSLIFSFGFLIVLIFVYFTILLAVVALSAFAISELLLGGADFSTVFWTTLAILVVVQPLAGALDKRLGPRLAPGGRAGRALSRLVRLGFTVSPMRVTGPIQLTLGSNLSEGKVAAGILAVSLLLGGGFLAKTITDVGLLRLDNRAYFPASLREKGIDPAHYRDRWSGDSWNPRTPSVQSEVVDGHYLELSVPYLPQHNRLVAEQCPDLGQLRATGLTLLDRSEPIEDEVQRAAACFGSLFEVRLDRALLANLDYDFGLEPQSGLEAVMTRIPVRDLTPGRHELVVVTPPKRSPIRSSSEGQPVRHVIPFWR